MNRIRILLSSNEKLSLKISLLNIKKTLKI